MINERDEHIIGLLFKRIVGSITEDEQHLIDEWRKESDAHEQLYARLLDAGYLKKEYLRRSVVNTQRPLEDMQHRIDRERKGNVFVTWRPWVAAASIAIIVCLGFAKLWTSSEKITEQTVAQTHLLSDIKPGSLQATLTLADGVTVQLGADSATNVHTIKAHQTVAQTIPDIKQLSLDVPRGGEFKIMLEDSTEVWLNSESKLIYPETFSTNERRVTVTGEAYFKVAKDKSRPFLVETDGQLVKVYGTEFNIRSYAEDKGVLTTLIEGSVSISKLSEKSGELMLTPGHQACFNRSDESTSVKEVNTAVVTCWKMGRFVFENQTLRQIMRDLSRWYNFDYQFEEEGLSEIEFMGSIPRYSDFAAALALLKKSGGLTFRMEGDKVVIARDKAVH